MRKLHKYKNPWHKKFDPVSYGPEEYETHENPIEYRGYLIYNRDWNIFDIVKDGTCIHQRAGLDGAKRAIDKLIE